MNNKSSRPGQESSAKSSRKRKQEKEQNLGLLSTIKLSPNGLDKRNLKKKHKININQPIARTSASQNKNHLSPFTCQKMQKHKNNNKKKSYTSRQKHNQPKLQTCLKKKKTLYLKLLKEEHKTTKNNSTKKKKKKLPGCKYLFQTRQT